MNEIYKSMYLYEVPLEYPGYWRITIYDNGSNIFQGTVKAIMKYVDAEKLGRKVDIYINDEYKTHIYLQR